MVDLTHTFTVGQEVSFNRNMSVKADSTPIIAQVLLHIPEEGRQKSGREVKQEDLTYVIEHEIGWIPNSIRKAKFGLEDSKKYLFVSEKELSVIK
jgi:hypothetical protein